MQKSWSSVLESFLIYAPFKKKKMVSQQFCVGKVILLFKQGLRLNKEKKNH